MVVKIKEFIPISASIHISSNRLQVSIDTSTRYIYKQSKYKSVPMGNLYTSIQRDGMFILHEFKIITKILGAEKPSLAFA